MSTIHSGQRLHTENNIGAVRYLLALAVVVAHFNLLSGAEMMFPITSYQGVCGFFAISGFLIFRSFHRAGGNVGQYLYRRGVRILPSYFFVVIAATLTLWTVSTLSLADYFSSSQTWRYLVANLAFMNFIEPSLPGVFSDGVATAVNGSLWTMKVEWALYLSLPIVAWLINKRSYRAWVVIGITYALSVGYRWGFRELYDATGNSLYEILSRQFFGQMTYFYVGALLYCYYDQLRERLAAIGVVALVIVVGAYFFAADSGIYYYVVGPMALAALVLSLGLTGRWGGAVARVEDCSYEIYLVHYPIVQLMVGSRLAERVDSWILFCITVVAVVVVAYVTARFVSAPLRRRLKR